MKISQLTIALSLTLALSPAIADRPAMSERDAEAVTEPVYQAPAEPVELEPVDTGMSMQQTTGDVLQIQPDETIPVNVLAFPRRGMDMSRVQNELGEPLMISPTVGQPPITTWSYPDRKVYFEGRTVIHAVAIN